jgi:hypothetical protein
MINVGPSKHDLQLEVESVPGVVRTVGDNRR